MNPQVLILKWLPAVQHCVWKDVQSHRLAESISGGVKAVKTSVTGTYLCAPGLTGPASSAYLMAIVAVTLQGKQGM